MVARRFVLLVLVAELADSVALEVSGARADARTMRKRALDQLLGLGFTPGDFERGERSFVMSLRTGQVNRNDATAAMQRLECAGVLAWALGLEAAILPIEQRVELAPLRAHLPAEAATLRAFSDHATLRAMPELLAARHDCATQWFPREGAPPSEERRACSSGCVRSAG